MSDNKEIIKGFSKLNRTQRISMLENSLKEDLSTELDRYLHSNEDIQQVFSEFSENFLSNYYLPLGVIPNVYINNQKYLVPVVIEESSVVAAASRSAGFWAKNGGFKTKVISTTKKGQVHFTWSGGFDALNGVFSELKTALIDACKPITIGMEKRGGGISEVALLDKTSDIENYYQLDISFETVDAMGANFINSCLEQMSQTLGAFIRNTDLKGELEVVMSILSNYTPNCIVECKVECPVNDLAPMSGAYTPADFARRFKLAVDIANCDKARAVTHNKGVFNGVDGVVLSTGNDWRAIEAGGHAFAAKGGSYKSLSEVEINDGVFSFTLTIPLAMGTVGGLTQSHPLAKLTLKVLGNPSAERLMEVAAAVGLANNFSAVSSLITTGIQKGHMKMHLSNILSQLGASELEKEQAQVYFLDKNISYSAVKTFLTRTTN